MPRDDDQPETRSGINPWSVSGMGMELVGSIIGALLLGWGVDYFFRTSPWGIVIGAFVGLVGGGYNFAKQARKLQRRSTAGMNPSRYRTIHDGEGDGVGVSSSDADAVAPLREGSLLEERERPSMMDRMFGAEATEMVDEEEIRWPEGFEGTPDLPEDKEGGA